MRVEPFQALGLSILGFAVGGYLLARGTVRALGRSLP